jgi:predicted nucleic acid-binding protein
MKPKVYIETTVISYLTAWPSRDVVIAGHQQVTREWWKTAGNRHELWASELVVHEASAGDPIAARDRLAELDNLQMLTTSTSAENLAAELIDSGAVPPQAAEDALHIALAVTNGIDYLVTWNCRHIANAALRSKIERVCRDAGYQPTVICTPEELLGEFQDVQ